jgi:integrase/recombinase XerD
MAGEEIVARWLTAKATGRGRLATTTLAQYRIKAERLFWYARRTGAPTSAWTLDDFAGFIAFLQAADAVCHPHTRSQARCTGLAAVPRAAH